MLYISFHGSPLTNTIFAYDDNGNLAGTLLAPSTGTPPSPPLNELRAFCFASPNLLYVVNGYKDYSQVLLYTSAGNGSYSYHSVFASPQVDSIFHPYDLTFDTNGNCYISNQDTNVVAGLSSPNTPVPLPSFISDNYGQNFLRGTVIASSSGDLPKVALVATDVPVSAGGLNVRLDPTSGKVAHSVRGVLWNDGYLYVADEPNDSVNVYDATGALYGRILGSILSAPVQLLLEGDTLYISSSGSATVVSVDLSKGAPKGNTEPGGTFIGNSHLKSISGMAVDTKHFYAADRKHKLVNRYHLDSGKFKDAFIENLPDEPEFIVYSAG